MENIFPQFQLVEDIYETSFNNSNTILHTPITLFNSARIDAGQNFYFYKDGASRACVKFMENMDSERLEIGRKLGIKTVSTLDILNSFLVNQCDNLYDAIHQNDSYRVVKAPATLEHRYITEDVPFGLVPLSKIGKKVNVPTPHIDTLIKAYELLLNKDLNEMGPDIDYDMFIEKVNK